MSSNSSDGRPDQYAGPAVPTPTDMGALPHNNQARKLNATIWCLTSLAGVFLFLRVYCKFLRRKGLWWDDYILMAAWICLTVETSLLTLMTSYGYGLHIWDFDPHNMPQLLRVINVAGSFSVTAAIWSKTSFAITLLRLTDGRMKLLIWGLIITMNIAMGLSALFPWVQCTPVQKAWNVSTPGTCWPSGTLVKYNIFSAAYSAAMDITLAFLPWKVVWALQMQKKERFGVAIAMSMGVFAGITAVVKTTKLPLMLSPDFADGVDLFIWGNAESSVTIIAASIPVLRVLVREVKQTYGRNSMTGVRSLKSTRKASEGNMMQIPSATSRTARRFDTRVSDTWYHDGSGDKIASDEEIRAGGILRTDDFSVEFYSKAS